MSGRSNFVARDEVDNLQYGDCFSCRETVMRGMEKKTQKAVMLDPRPVGGGELNPIRARHTCKLPSDE